VVFVLHNRHTPSECAAAFAAWKGFDSPLRHRQAVCNCVEGGHQIWWLVDACDPAAALALLPPYVAARSTATRVRPFETP
jgi:hypothetical protein